MKKTDAKSWTTEDWKRDTNVFMNIDLTQFLVCREMLRCNSDVFVEGEIRTLMAQTYFCPVC